MFGHICWVSVPAAARPPGLARSRHHRRRDAGGFFGRALVGDAVPYLAEYRHRGRRTRRECAPQFSISPISSGSATGSILTGFVLMEHLGLVHIAACWWRPAFLRLVADCAFDLSRSEKPAGGFATPLDWWRLLGSPLVRRCSGSSSWKGAASHQSIVDVVENRSGIITVDRDGTVFGNGMYDGRFNTDLKHDTNGIVRPYALSLFHPAPRDVLMIGLSSGSWAQVIANNPDVRSLTVVEINPGYLTLIRRNRKLPRF